MCCALYGLFPSAFSRATTNTRADCHTGSARIQWPVHSNRVGRIACRRQRSWNILLTVRRFPKRQKIHNTNQHTYVVTYVFGICIWSFSFWVIYMCNNNGRSQGRKGSTLEMGLGTLARQAGSTHVRGMIYIGKLRYTFAYFLYRITIKIRENEGTIDLSKCI